MSMLRGPVVGVLRDAVGAAFANDVVFKCSAKNSEFLVAGGDEARRGKGNKAWCGV